MKFDIPRSSSTTPHLHRSELPNPHNPNDNQTGLAAAAATPTIRLAVETIPSHWHREPPPSAHPMRATRWLSARWWSRFMLLSLAAGFQGGTVPTMAASGI